MRKRNFAVVIFISFMVAGAAVAASDSAGFNQGALVYDEDGIQRITMPDVEISGLEARQIAVGFIFHQAASGQRPEWDGATTGRVTPYWSMDGVLEAYEVEVRSREGIPAGWLVVEAWRDFDPVSSYTTEGLTNTETLQVIYELKHGGRMSQGEDSYRFLWSGPGSAAVQVIPVSGEPTFLLTMDPGVDGGSYDHEARRLSYMAVEDFERLSPERQKDKMSFGEERAALRWAYLKKSFDSRLFDGTKASLDFGDDLDLKADIGNGASEFSNLTQVRRTWNNSSNSTNYCYAGCAPVAYAIVLEYWDRHGYPGMVGSTTDNSNTSSWDSDVIWLVDELRWNLQTYCSSHGGNGTTSSAYFTRAVDHVNSRGVGTWTSDDTNSWTKWSRFKGQINIGNPAVVHYDSDEANGSIDHSAAGYEYTDNSGSTNDWICVKTGWSSTTWDCFTRTSVGNYRITRLMRP